MPSAVVLGAGMMGRVMAADLSSDAGFEVAIADVNGGALEGAARGAGGRVKTIEADLSDTDELARVIGPYDIVLGALASRIGYQTLEAVIGAGKHYCDISFMPENALDFDEAAKSAGVTAVVDCGVAPGMSNMLSGYGASLLDTCEEIEIYVGGLPKERRWPYEYKAGFSPSDVIEEYTRVARYVVDGEVVEFPALSEPELMDFDGVGTLEAFNTDGLRSLIDTMDVPRMKEKTLRYPGHIELMRVFRETGLFSQDEIEVNGVKVRPLDVMSKLMFPMWTFEEGEADVTVMRVIAQGMKGGARERHVWDLHDEYDPATGWTSMGRTTALPCAVFARMVASGRIEKKGVLPPEVLGSDGALVETMLEEMRARGVEYVYRREGL